MKIADAEWQFYKIEDAAELRVVWRWEIERQAGSGALPWLTLKKPHRAKLIEYLASDRPPVKEKPIREMTAYYDAIRGDNIPFQLHGFEIDWSRGKDTIRKWFSTWVSSQAHFKAQMPWRGWKNKGGRKNSHRAWLTDLALTRLAAQKVSPLQRQKLMIPFLLWSGKKDNFSPISCSRAKRRTGQRADISVHRHFFLAVQVQG